MHAMPHVHLVHLALPFPLGLPVGAGAVVVIPVYGLADRVQAMDLVENVDLDGVLALA